MRNYLKREQYRIVYMAATGYLECLVTDTLGKDTFCTSASSDPNCKKIVEITKI